MSNKNGLRDDKRSLRRRSSSSLIKKKPQKEAFADETE